MIQIHTFIFQRLKAALHYTVGRICEKAGKLRMHLFGRGPLHIFAFVASNLILIKRASVTEPQISYSMPSHFMDRKLMFLYNPRNASGFSLWVLAKLISMNFLN